MFRNYSKCRILFFNSTLITKLTVLCFQESKIPFNGTPVKTITTLATKATVDVKQIEYIEILCFVAVTNFGSKPIKLIMQSWKNIKV